VRALITATQARLAGASGEANLWRRLEAELKRRLDPKNILNPGGI
jgi:FAD/FMN-containing dehydrogenase